MSDIERFKKRKNNLRKAENYQNLHLVVDKVLVDSFLNSEIDFDLIQSIDVEFDSTYNANFDISVSDDDAKDLLKVLEKEFNDEHFKNLVSACKNNVLASIVGPFGLGELVSHSDKDAGNVDTPNGVRHGVYASEIEKIKFESREEYNGVEYHSHENYIATNRKVSHQKEAGKLKDSYSGRNIKQNEKVNLDHTISAKEIHDDPARILAEVNGPNIANKSSNLNPTAESINKSKKQKPMTEFLEMQKNNEDNRRAAIYELSNKSKLTQKEQKTLNKLKQQEDINPELAAQCDEVARKQYNSTITKEYFKSSKFIKNSAITSTQEGSKMGAQQALGLVCCEFFQATFDELSDIYNNGFEKGFKGDKFFDILKMRLQRIATRIANRWEDVTEAFGKGFISGFLSNLLTIVSKELKATAKMANRIIREGFFSLLQAIKLLCVPPKDMTGRQAAHEATKLIAGVLVISGGIALENYVRASIGIVPILGEYVDKFTAVIIGALTAITTTFVVYAIDKLDLFRVKDIEKHNYVMQKLESNLENNFLEIDNLMKEF